MIAEEERLGVNERNTGHVIALSEHFVIFELLDDEIARRRDENYGVSSET